MKKLSSLLLVILVSVTAVFAQDAMPEMATAMRESGKIYVVVGVMTIIFAGIIVYLFILDRRIGRMEKEQKDVKSGINR